MRHLGKHSCGGGNEASPQIVHNGQGKPPVPTDLSQQVANLPIVFRADLAALQDLAAEGVHTDQKHARSARKTIGRFATCCERSEEHTSELQSRSDLVCRLLLEK